MGNKQKNHQRKIPTKTILNGFHGIYFDTPNNSLIKFFLKQFKEFEIIETATPEEKQKRIKLFYKNRVRTKGFSKKYLNSPIRRIIIKF